MNRKQKTCLLVGITAGGVMGLWPPWVLERRTGLKKYILEPGPYSWIASPPVIDAEKSSGKWYQSIYSYSAKERITVPARCEATARFIDLYRLGVQYFMVAVVTAGLIIILGGKKDKNKSPMTLRWIIGCHPVLFKFTLVSSIALGFIVPTIIILFFYVADGFDWDDDMAGFWILGLLLFAGLWILYSIIRWIIIPISRWAAKSFRDV